nr:ribonuclease H-like domain-containing protein [Tanacetum cinerariifolium]
MLKKRDAATVKLALLLKSRKFGDSYEAPKDVAASASDGAAKKKGRTAAVTTDDMQKRKNNVKARTTLLLALPDEHQLRFSKYKTAQELWAAILKTFGGNEATKKIKKNLLKQQYGNFKAEGTETLKRTFNRLQVIVNHFEFMDIEIEQDDLNQKFLTSLALEWLMHTIVWRNKSDLDTMSLDYLYNHFKDINQIDEDDIEEMDIKWNMALLSMRADRFWKKTRKKITIQGTDVAGFDKSKVKCFNCHKMGHFARECKAPRSQDRGRRDNYRQSFMANEEEDHALVADEEIPTEFSLMAKTSADSEVFDNSLCSKTSKKNTDSLSRLPEFADDTITDYSRPSPAIESTSDDVQNRNTSNTKTEVSPGTISPKPFIKFVKATDRPAENKIDKVETAKKPHVKYAKQYRKPSKKSNGNSQNHIDDKGYWDSGCSRNMTCNISYLFDYEPFDGGYVCFGQGGCKITGKGTIKPVNLSLKTDFKLIDNTNVLLRTPRQHNMYSIDLNNIVPHKDLTCLVAKASADEWKQHKASCKSKLVNSVTKPLHTLHMDLFSPTSDDTSGILRKFITKIENLEDLNVKIIRCDNGGEFRNKEMNDFCSRKRIKREFSNARTPQQNGVAERRNKTLIEAARTITPAIGFLKPFGCHVMILNTLDNLEKFEANRDKGYFIGYSMSSKAFKVFNKRTKRVEENLHVDFLENKAIEKGTRPNWLFDIDSLAKSINYVPVVVAGTNSTNLSGTKDATSQEVKKDVSFLRYIALPNWVHDALLESPSSNAQDTCKANAFESSGNPNPTASTSNPLADQMETLTVETPIPTVSSHVPTACFEDSPELTTTTRIISKRVTSQDETPSLDTISTLANRFDDILGVTTSTVDSHGKEADVSNMETTITASPTPTLRIHKDHPKSQIIGPVDTPIQTRHKSKEMEEQSFIATIHQKTNPALLQFCLFTCFLSQVEPKKISYALQDPSWVEAMQEKLLQFKIQNVWTLVNCPKGEEGIDYNKIFAPVARIKAIRIFLAYASFMRFTVYQMDVKSTFLYGTIDEEVYVMQPSGFQDLEFPVRVYKVEKAMYRLHQAPRAALMHEKFQMSAMGELNFFFGLQVLQKEDSIFLSQDKYVEDIIKKFGYSDVRSSNTPMDKENPWGKYGTIKDVDLHLYRYMIGSLMYLTASRPDIIFAVCACARHQMTLKESYSDSYYGVATQDRKSTTRGCQFLGKRLISWQCKKQTIVATSTTEAEYVAAASGCGQVLIETMKEGAKILATVDGKLRTMSESSIRRNLKLNDEAGISSLLDAELFENLTLMGYNISPNQKFTFQKGQFSRQWKYLIHTIMQCLSPKSTRFNEFSSNIATALVCLATSRVFNFSKMIFDGMVRNVNNKVSKFLTYLRFLSICLRMGQFGKISHTHTYVVPFHTRKLFTTLRGNNPSFSGRTVPLFDSILVPQGEGSGTPTEPHHTTTFEASQSSQHELPSPSLPPSLALSPVANELAPPIKDDSQGEACPTDSGLEADQDRENIPKTSTLPSDSIPRVTSLVADEGTHELEINRLKARIKLLEDKDRGVVEQSGDDAPIKGMSLDEGEEAAERVNDDTEEMATILTFMDAASIVTSGGVQMVLTASKKRKEKMEESDTPKKKKLQEQIDVQVARELEEEMTRDAQRMNKLIAKDAEIARIHVEEELQIMIDGLDRNNETTQQRKPLTRKQQREFYTSVLRNQARWKAKHFKGMTLEEIKEKFDPVWKQIQDFIPIGLKEKAERFKRKGLRLEQESVMKLKTSKGVKATEEVPEEKVKEMMQLVPVEERGFESVMEISKGNPKHQASYQMEALGYMWGASCVNKRPRYLHANRKGLPSEEGSGDCDDQLQDSSRELLSDGK